MEIFYEKNLWLLTINRASELDEMNWFEIDWFEINLFHFSGVYLVRIRIVVTFAYH